MLTLGTLTPLWSLITPPTITEHLISLPIILMILNFNKPSSTRIVPPIFTSL